jgi:epsin
LPSEDLFGESAFAASHPQTSFPAPTPAPFTSVAPSNNVPNGNFQAFGTSSADNFNSSFGGSPFPAAPSASPAQVYQQTSFLPPPPSAPTSAFSAPSSFQPQPGSAQRPNFPFPSSSSYQAPSGQAPFGGNAYGQSANTGLLPSQAPSSYVTAPAPSKPQQNAFQPKSSIWSDTINSGLVDLDISGVKTNPLAEFGLDGLKDSIFSTQEIRKKQDRPLPAQGNMGKAMGSGTGLGKVGAAGIAPPPAPSMMGGMNLGMGMGMRQPSMGLGMNMNQGMAPNVGYAAAPGMGVNPGYGVPPGMEMAPGMGQGPNPGMGGYGPGMGMVQGGYVPMGGYPNQQYSGYR